MSNEPDLGDTDSLLDKVLKDSQAQLDELLKGIQEQETEALSSLMESLPGADGLTSLERCQQAFSALTTNERTQFIYWMTTYLHELGAKQGKASGKKGKGRKPKGEVMVPAMLMVKNPGSTHWEGMGGKEFVVLPRIGEFIEIAVGEKGFCYRVVAVGHPDTSIPDVTVVDIYAVQIGDTPSVLVDLFNRS